MNATVAIGQNPQPDWFESWFDSSHYHQLYAHRDNEEAARFIDRLVERLEPRQGARILDVGCGTGRHAKCLAAMGFDVTGLDLSAESIKQATESQHANLRFRRHDMRLPFGTKVFDYVINLFTSFGYFEDPADHLAVIRNIATSLKPGGIVVLDYLNARFAEEHLTPEEVIRREGVVYHIARWADSNHIFKRVLIDQGAAFRPLQYVERVAKLTVDDFHFMFALNDMRVVATYGDYALAPFVESNAPRLIVVAMRAQDCPQAELASRQVLPNATDRFGRHAEIRGQHRLRHALGNRRVHPEEFEVPLLG